MKRCPACDKSLPLTEFHRHRGNRDGLQYRCKRCHREQFKASRLSDPLRTRETDRRVNDRHRIAHCNNRLQRKFGITRDTYYEILWFQGGCCEICKSPANGKRLAVDHCHVSGTVRGLLCDLCNWALGMGRDNPGLLRAAADYLERNSAAE